MREGDASDAPASRQNFCWSIGRGCPLRLDNRLDSRTPVPAWGLPAGLYGEDASPYPAGYAAVGMSAPASSAFALTSYNIRPTSSGVPYWSKR